MGPAGTDVATVVSLVNSLREVALYGVIILTEYTSVWTRR